jgi:hypothetical protein
MLLLLVLSELLLDDGCSEARQSEAYSPAAAITEDMCVPTCHHGHRATAACCATRTVRRIPVCLSSHGAFMPGKGR